MSPILFWTFLLGASQTQYSTTLNPTRESPAFGLALDVPINRFLYIHSEVLHTQDDSHVPTADGQVNLNARYLQVPLMVRVNVPITRWVVPYVMGGPTLSKLISATQNVNGIVHGTEEDVHAWLNNNVFSLSAGIGLDIYLSESTGLSLSVPQVQGYTSKLKNQDVLERKIQALFGVVFAFDKLGR